MDRRPVSQVRRAEDGRVAGLADPGKPWSPRMAADVVRDIVDGVAEYYVPWAEGDVDVRVIGVQQGAPDLWCDRDRSPRNNLLDLPEAT
jgi:hypothetical protein